MRSIVAFDLEGPLSPQDNAYELMGTIDGGYEIFEKISRYDDILTIEGREGYEPGDTLYLILPFLALEGKEKKDVLEVSEKAQLTPGAHDVMEYIKKMGWKRVIISTSYEPHAYHIGNMLGVGKEDIACTKYPLNGIELNPVDRKTIMDFRERLKTIPVEDDNLLKSVIDDFYLNTLPSMEIYGVISDVKVVGGTRKIEALKRFCDYYEPSKIICIGDSITDIKMLEYVRDSEGLSIAFNGNEYAVPAAMVGVASLNLFSVIPVIERFIRGGIDSVVDFIKYSPSDDILKGYYDYIPHCEDLDEVISRHKLMRREMRGRAGNLG